MNAIYIPVVFVLTFVTSTVFGGNQTYDDFLTTSTMVRGVKDVGLLILSQSDPSAAEHDAGQMRKQFWAARPEATVTKDDAEIALKGFDNEFAKVAQVVRERKIQSLSLAGVDLVLLTSAQDWYFAATTIQGPVLIKVSIQWYQDKPMTIHGIQIYTNWDEIKSITHAIHLPPAEKVFTVNLDSKPASTSKTEQKD